MPVPDTNTFPLSVVVAEIGASQPRLSTCFAEASGNFNPSYQGNKDRLSNFRGYNHNPIPFYQHLFKGGINTSWTPVTAVASFLGDGTLRLETTDTRAFPAARYGNTNTFPLPTGFPDGTYAYKFEIVIAPGSTATGFVELFTQYTDGSRNAVARVMLQNGAITQQLPMAFNRYMIFGSATIAPFGITTGFTGRLDIESITISPVTAGFSDDTIFNIPGNLQGWQLGTAMTQQPNGSLLRAANRSATAMVGKDVAGTVGTFMSINVLFDNWTAINRFMQLSILGGAATANTWMYADAFASGQRMTGFIRQITAANQGLIVNKVRAGNETGLIWRISVYQAPT